MGRSGGGRQVRTDKLGLRPSIEDVDQWFVAGGAHFERIVVGRSIEGRDLTLYRRVVSPNGEELSGGGDENGGDADTTTATATVLFLSLVHGNEPLGLVALLRTAEALLHHRARNRHLRALSSSRGGRRSAAASHLELLFLPVVNPDAYALNLRSGVDGCRRTNLNATCPSLPRDDPSPCPSVSAQGVDLNRNFDLDFQAASDPCFGGGYPGAEPFSEPESRAVRDVVLQYRPGAVMSYHSRKSSDQALLVHPYGSDAPGRVLDAASRARFDAWAERMGSHRRNLYLSGDARETVGYSARGVAIDWMFALGNVSVPFVHESGTPCGRRWCGDEYRGRVREDAGIYAYAGVRMVDLALAVEDPSHWLSPLLALIVVVLGVVVVRMGDGGRLSDNTARRRHWRLKWASFHGSAHKEKSKKTDEERDDWEKSVEMRQLLIDPAE